MSTTGRNEESFPAWQERTVQLAVAHAEELGLSAGDLVAIIAAQTAWRRARDAGERADESDSAARLHEREARRRLEKELLAISKMPGEGEQRERGGGALLSRLDGAAYPAP